MVDTEKDILSSDDAAMMLYVAGELDDAGRQKLESRLKGDEGLRARLADMTQLDTLMQEDAAARPVAVVDSRRALSASLRLVREQALVLQSRPMIRPAGRRLVGVPRWMWGTAAAAAVAVGMLVWISNSDPTPPQAPLAQNTDGSDGPGRFPGIAEARAFGAAFLPIQAEGSEGQSGEINSEVDALNMLAVMNDPNDGEANEK